MKTFKTLKILSLTVLFFLTSCLAAGVPYTSDPRMKLSYALQMDTFGRCIPAINLAKDALKDFEKKDNKVGMQYAYLVLSINSEVNCKMNSRISPDVAPTLAKEYFLKAMEIDTPKENAEAAIDEFFKYLTTHKNILAVEVYHKFKIIQFYHLILATKYGSKDSAEKLIKCQKLIEDARKQIPNREYYYEFGLPKVSKKIKN